MDIKEYRERIDNIDAKILELFADRMEVAKGIAEYKQANNLPVLDSERERQKLNSIIEQSRDEVKEYTPILYSLIFELSRKYQNKVIAGDSEGK